MQIAEKTAPRSAARAAVLAAVSVASISFPSNSSIAATVTWDGGTSANGAAWLSTINWGGDVIPGPTDRAEIVATGTQPDIGVNMNSAGTNNGPANEAVGAIRLTSGSRTLFNLALTTTGTLTLKGDGTSVLLSNSTATGNLTILKSVAGSAAMNVALDAGGEVDVVNAGASIAISANIANGLAPAALTKTGAGAFSLTGQNTFQNGSGNAVIVNGGSLTIANASGTGVSGNVVVNNSQSTFLSGANTTSSIGGMLTLNAGTVAEPGGAGVLGTLAIGSLVGNDAILNFDITDLGQDLLNSGPVTLSGVNTINITGGNFALGDYLLINYPSRSGAAFALGTTPSIPGYTYNLVTGSTATILQVIPEPLSLAPLCLAALTLRRRRS